jgi:hypothetical protein
MQPKRRWSGRRASKRLASVHAARVSKRSENHLVGALSQRSVIPITLLERKLVELQKVVLHRIAIKKNVNEK